MLFTRRDFVRATVTGALAAGIASCRDPAQPSTSRQPAPGEWVNDVHSQLNRTHVAGIARPQTREQLVQLIETAHRRGESISFCGGRHAGGGQQFRTDRWMVDLSNLNRVLAFDPAAGTIEVESGIHWPAVLDFLNAQPAVAQSGADDRPTTQWAIHQKQGGADELSLGGAIASNIHGRCLASRPIVRDVVSMQLITPDGRVVTCDRRANGERFAHVVGGYGLFGVVYSLTLRLQHRRKLVRRVRWIAASEAIATLESRRDAGAWHGDFQFAVDERQPDFCAAGLCSWYEPVPDETPLSAPSHHVVAEQFSQLVTLAHEDKARALAAYREMTLSQDGRVIDWSDTWQLGDYVPGYHAAIDALHRARNTNGAAQAGSEILSELYVPRGELARFLASAAAILRGSGANLIYGTVRLIERDDETALAWAKRDYACVIFNLHTELTPREIAANAVVFRGLLDAAIALDGSYYLTYHRFARPDQTMQCYPQLAAFLVAKRRFDPRETLDSDWYRHYRGVTGA
jgi:FAD/FMN-containing dehydrogenase